jgi:hypothetical protein
MQVDKPQFFRTLAPEIVSPILSWFADFESFEARYAESCSGLPESRQLSRLYID